MKEKKWLYQTIGSLAACLLSFAVMTVVVDPYFHYHKPLEGMSYRLYEQRYINNGIAKQFDYDAIIIGSSMVENFKTSEFDEKFAANSIKLSFAGAGYYEISQNLQRAFAYNSHIEQVLWCLDWTSLMKEVNYQNYLDYPTYLYDDFWWNDVNYVLNKDIMYHGTLTNLWMTIEGMQSTTFDEYSARNEQTGYEAVMEGYQRKDTVVLDRRISEQERILVENNIRENILTIVEANPDTMFYFYYPPYSVVRWDEWNRGGMCSVYVDAAQIATELLLKYDNVRLFCFSENIELTADLNNYRDTIHYAPDVNSQILQWIKEEKYRITVDNYEEHGQKLKEIYSEFDYDEIFKDKCS